MRIWIRTDRPTEFRVRYDRNPELSAESPTVQGQTDAAHDFTGWVDLRGLRPAKTYFYSVEIDGKAVPIPTGDEMPLRFRTWPSRDTFAHPDLNPKGLSNAVIGVGVCNHIGGAKESAVYRNLLERHQRELDLFIMNGDYLYELGRKRIKPREIATDDARADYKAYLDGLPDMARFFARTPMLFQFDDHEIGPEQATAEIGLKVTEKLRNAYTNPLLRDITLQAWREYCGWANPPMPAHRPLIFGQAEIRAGDPVLVDEGADFSVVTRENTTSLHLHMDAKNGGVYAVEEVIDPHRLRLRPAPERDESGAPYSIGTHHYYDLRKGNAHLFVLDTRSERTLYRVDRQRNPDQRILGESQMKWLLNGVSKTDAEFIIVVSPVPWTIWHNASHVKGRAVSNAESDKEDGFIGTLAEREPLLEAFDRLKKPVVILSGDLHSGYGVQVTDNVWEFLISPIASDLHPLESGGNPPMGGWFDSNGRRVKIKWASAYPMAYTEEFRAQGRRHGFVYGLVRVKNIFPTGVDKTGATLWKAYDTPSLQVEVRDAESDEVVYAETISPLDAD
ncbi:MAG: alkaline phosphatase D family protein [Verrucomicrobiae bacterium]|nr:alkaline phosphatase D family protein [Verrucomicrobiae bacterium]MCB1087179.1 alkaline phosphatase D family protein [Verrucomicrobiae bacterium]